jgi:hypothetical protein
VAVGELASKRGEEVDLMVSKKAAEEADRSSNLEAVEAGFRWERGKKWRGYLNWVVEEERGYLRAAAAEEAEPNLKLAEAVVEADRNSNLAAAEEVFHSGWGKK